MSSSRKRKKLRKVEKLQETNHIVESDRSAFVVNKKRTRSKLKLHNIEGLIQYILADGKAPTWVAVRNKFNIKHIVVLYLPDLILAENLSHFWPLNWHSLATDLLLMNPKSSSKIEQTEYISPVEYVLSVDQLAEFEYPAHSLHSKITAEDWIETEGIDADTQPDASDILAIDCEMCVTTHGSELTRISVVRFMTKQVILDELVKPPNEITDYVTTYSGITEEMLKNVEVTLQDIQKKLKSLIKPATILLGHSLCFDLKALKYSHPFIIDTATLYRDSREAHFRPKLKWLCTRYLRRSIQNSCSGHDSVEDAMACIDLLELKVQYGHRFGSFQRMGKSIFEYLREEYSLSSAFIDSNPLKEPLKPDKSICAKAIEIPGYISMLQQDFNIIWAAVREVDTPQQIVDEVWHGLETNTALIVYTGGKVEVKNENSIAMETKPSFVYMDVK